MAIAVADSWYVEDPDDTPTSVAVSGFQAGDVAVVICFSFNNVTGANHATPTDNGSNTYTDRTENTRTSTFRTICSISDAVIVTPPTSIQFIMNLATGVGQSVVVLRLTGVDTSSMLDDVDENQVTGDDPSSDAVTATTDGIVISGISYDGDAIALTAPSGWTTAEEVESSAAVAFSVAYKLTTAGSHTAAWVTGSSADYSMVIAAYKAATGTTVEFPIATGDDDSYGRKRSATWAGMVASSDYTNQPDSTDYVSVSKGVYSGTDRAVVCSYYRFDTSSLPDDAIITGASLKLYVLDRSSAGDAEYAADYYDFGGAPSVIGDWELSSSGDAIATITRAQLVLSTIVTIPLTGFSGINRTGYTGLRLGPKNTVEPTLDDWVDFASYENASFQEPRLEITYTTEEVTDYFPIAVAGDDGTGYRSQSASEWPPTGAYTAMSGNNIGYTAKGASYSNNTFLRFDTSSLPDGATITGARIGFHALSVVTVAGYLFEAEYYDFGGDPAVLADYAFQCTTPILSVPMHTDIAADAWNWFALTDVSGISKTGYTGLRFALNGAQPVADRSVQMAMEEHSHADGPAVLEVTYLEEEEVVTAYRLVPPFIR